MSRFLSTALLSTALLTSITIAPMALRAEDHKSVRYHDAHHNDDHEWNDHEDRAYRIWAKDNHRKYVEFAKLKENNRQDYWRWRHEHSDTLLKIDIR